jgi:Heterokaryon incompatibility protein (HET)
MVVDAMTIVKELDERYLCVDALRIIQDDKFMKADLINDIDSIYGSAVSTIVAAGPIDPKCGISIFRCQDWLKASPPDRGGRG